MPHQCLKCGKVFPSGSPEILKGCSDCGGKRFFYTEQPVPDSERERLIEQANKDIKVLIREILAQSQDEKFKGFDSEGKSVPSVSYNGESDWVKVTPPSASGGPGKIEPAEAPKAGFQVEPEAGNKVPTVKEILEELRGKPELVSEERGKRKKQKAGEKAVRRKRKKKVKFGDKLAKDKKVSLKPRVKSKKPRRRPKPEIITVREPGVYDIQLDKLMKGFPIIINRDGTYLVHLPSVFESFEKDRKQKKD